MRRRPTSFPRSPLVPLLLVLASLPGAASARAAGAPAYTMSAAEDRSEGEFFRARFTVESQERLSPAVAEAIARDIVERRTGKRLLHVIDVRIHAPGTSAEAPPDAVVLWAAGGDPSRKPAASEPPNTFTVHVGAAAIEEARRLDALAPDVPIPAGTIAPAPEPEPGAAAPVTKEVPEETIEAATTPPLADVPPATEEPRAPPAARRPAPPSVTAIAPPVDAAPLDPKRRTREEVLSFVRGWKAAWQAKDLAAYLAMYAPQFRSGGLDLAGWEERKRSVFENAGELRIELEEVQVSLEQDRAIVRFIQDYRSSVNSDRGRKTLVLVRKEGAWRIVQEDWTEL